MKIGKLIVIASSLVLASASIAAAAVPELDPGSSSMGVTLLVGGLLALNGRRRKR